MKKTLQQLTVKDNFMFAAVMLDEENARGVLERALDIPIDHVEVCHEKSIVYNPEYHGVRLDVYIKDAEGRHFNVEMQAVSKKIRKRARYYHSQMDLELLGSGVDYEKLPECYVIFICDFDPFGLAKYRYTVRKTLEEQSDYDYLDGAHTVYLSTAGKNEDEVPQALVKFLNYVKADLSESQEDYEDDFVNRLQQSVKKIKHDREMRRRYMLLEELMQDEYRAGKEEGRREGEEKGRREGRMEGIREVQLSNIFTFLSRKIHVSPELKNRITAIEDEDALAELLQKAADAESEEAFAKELDRMGF